MSVVSYSELLGSCLPEAVKLLMCLHRSLLKLLPEVACSKSDFIKWNEDNIVSSEMVLRTVCICPSVSAITGWLRGRTMGSLEAKCFRNSVRPLADSCRGGCSPPWLVPGKSSLDSSQLVESVLGRGTLMSVGVLLACGVTGPPTPELSRRSSTSVVSVKSLSGSSVRCLDERLISPTRQLSTYVVVALPAPSRGMIDVAARGNGIFFGHWILVCSAFSCFCANGGSRKQSQEYHGQW